MSEQTAVGRRYSGMNAEERTMQRKAAILAAGLELFGTAGYAATSVKQVCDTAGLTQRYFYESFSDRQDLLLAVYSGTVDEMRRMTVAAITEASADPDVDIVGAALSAFIEFLTADPRRARLVLIEVVGVAPVVEDRRHGVLRDFAGLVDAVWTSMDGTDRTATLERHLTAVSLVGAVNHLLVDWLLSGRTESPSILQSVCVGLFDAARSRFAPDSAQA